VREICPRGQSEAKHKREEENIEDKKGRASVLIREVIKEERWAKRRGGKKRIVQIIDVGVNKR